MQQQQKILQIIFENLRSGTVAAKRYPCEIEFVAVSYDRQDLIRVYLNRIEQIERK